MKTLQIDEVKAKKLYTESSGTLKSMLEDTFGKELLIEDITDKIKSYEDACRILNLNPDGLPDVNNCDKKDRKSIIAYYKLVIICRALNEEWEPNWADSEYKYYPWFAYGSYAGFGCLHTPAAASSASAVIGARLCFKSADLARYAGTQFLKIWEEYLMIKK